MRFITAAHYCGILRLRSLSTSVQAARAARPRAELYVHDALPIFPKLGIKRRPGESRAKSRPQDSHETAFSHGQVIYVVTALLVACLTPPILC